MTNSSLHPMTITKFHYAFALQSRQERLEEALAKSPRNDKEVTHLRQAVSDLKIANNLKKRYENSTNGCNMGLLYTWVCDGSNNHLGYNASRVINGRNQFIQMEKI